MSSQLGRELTPLAALAASSRALAAGATSSDALGLVTGAALAACNADTVVVRAADGDAALVRAVAAVSRSLAAELQGSRSDPAGLLDTPADELGVLPAALAATAARAQATAIFVVPLPSDNGTRATLELYRDGPPFDDTERHAAAIAADQAALALRAGAREGGTAATDPLELAGDALAAASDAARTAEHVVRLAARAAGADGAWLWRIEDGVLHLVGADGAADAPLPAVADQLVPDQRSSAVDECSGRPVVTLKLGQPPLGVLQLRFPPGAPLGEEALSRLASFAVRAAHALRAGERVRDAVGELDRSRALLEVLGQAISQLSLAHTVETAAARVTGLLGTERVAVYLNEPERGLVAAASAGLEGRHEAIAQRLLELALGPYRARGLVIVRELADDARVAAGLEPALAETGVRTAVALPLVVADEVVGLLAAYPEHGRVPTEAESALLVAFAAQLAVAVQNARLHERELTLSAEREDALRSLREARRLESALLDMSRSVAPNLPLDETLRAVVRAVTTWLEVDAAAIQLPDERGAALETRAYYVTEPRLVEVARTILKRSQPLDRPALARLRRTGMPLLLTPAVAESLGGAAALLAPFLEKGSSAGIVPIAASEDEVLGALTIVSFGAERPVTRETLATALTITRQAALMIDNARLYEHEKQFADTIQRSLLPRSAPTIPGLELGDVYESSATVEVGGDVYDYLTLADGRLAVVLGDVTGHGIDATADMAMAKYVFRSLAREHPEPGEFLAAANAVVAGEIAPGKFITMVELVVDAERGLVRCACAGHPAPRLVLPDGRVEALEVRGLALGIEDEQTYETAEAELPRGASVVVFTDGVVEARRAGELFGLERLDRVLSRERERPAKEIAETVLHECRRFGGELVDDCAVVVISRR